MSPASVMPTLEPFGPVRCPTSPDGSAPAWVVGEAHLPLVMMAWTRTGSAPYVPPVQRDATQWCASLQVFAQKRVMAGSLHPRRTHREARMDARRSRSRLQIRFDLAVVVRIIES